MPSRILVVFLRRVCEIRAGARVLRPPSSVLRRPLCVIPIDSIATFGVTWVDDTARADRGDWLSPRRTILAPENPSKPPKNN